MVGSSIGQRGREVNEQSAEKKDERARGRHWQSISYSKCMQLFAKCELAVFLSLACVFRCCVVIFAIEPYSLTADRRPDLRPILQPLLWARGM